MEIRPVGAELFHAEVRTNTTKLIVAFRNVAAASEDDNRSVTRIRSVVGRCADKCSRPACCFPSLSGILHFGVN
jgi:hypothetical protein